MELKTFMSKTLYNYCFLAASSVTSITSFTINPHLNESYTGHKNRVSDPFRQKPEETLHQQET
jgi:hypothetical protein